MAAATGLAAAAAAASHGHPLGHTTEDHTVVVGGDFNPAKPGFRALVEGPPSPRVTRDLPGASLLAGRAGRRRSLAYFAQLTDFQLADEESPARVEFVDPGASSAWRPQEAFHPWVIDWSFQQLNQFTRASPHPQALGQRARMDFALLTGDQSDNQQYNETLWVRQLVEGGEGLNPNSGSDQVATYSPECQARVAGGQLDPEEGPRYTGLQDYTDYPPGDSDYYDPENPTGKWGNWPLYPGLMDRAQLPFTPVGLRRGSTPVPSYVANGNHDGLVQGNEDAILAYEEFAVGCFKPFTHTPPATGPQPDPGLLLEVTEGFHVPPDPDRRFVDRVEMKRIYRSGQQPDDHGLAYIDPDENRASGFAATYFAWDAKPGVRFVSIDTVSDGGTVQDSSEGNIDDPQWRWLERELAEATADNKLIVVFGHHPVRSLTSETPDEAAARCTGRYQSPTGSDEQATYDGAKVRGHDPNPGCDLDPRNSTPIHHGDDLVELLSANRHVIAYVAGHTHENEIRACGLEPEAGGCPEGGNWWEVNTSATADWPQQHRLVEVMDNRDGTLSLLGTNLDHGSQLAIPGEQTKPDEVAAFNGEKLAALGRSFSYNDPQSERHTGSEGDPGDRNVELLVDDPRTRVIVGTPGRDVIRGTPGPDVVICSGGNDLVIAGGGDDHIRCGGGDDVVIGQGGTDRLGGDAGNDRLYGGTGNDRLYGRSGRDRVSGDAGRDHVYGAAGADRLYGGSGRDRLGGWTGNDRLGGGSGNDIMLGDRGNDRVFGGSGRDRMNGGSGRDRMGGQSGNDRVAGARDGDRIFGDAGNDRLFGGSGNDALFGRRGRDVLFGGRGRDSLFGGLGRDRLFGGRGRDRLFGGRGRDRLFGGPGRDRSVQ